MNIYFLLYYEFFKIGLFAIGGGYAAIPFLYHLSEQYSWYNIEELTNMIAVSNTTPGPIGINMATYAGYTTAGIIGSIIATIAIVTPSLIIVFLIIKLLKKHENNQFLNGIYTGIRPAACAMICAIGIKLFKENIIIIENNAHFLINYKQLVLFFLLMLLIVKLKKNPALIIGISAISGIILNQKII